MSATEALLEQMKANPMHTRQCSGKLKDKKLGTNKPVGSTSGGNQKTLDLENCEGMSSMVTTGSKFAGHAAGSPESRYQEPFAFTDDFRLMKPVSGLDLHDDLRGFAEIIQKVRDKRRFVSK